MDSNSYINESWLGVLMMLTNVVFKSCWNRGSGESCAKFQGDAAGFTMTTQTAPKTDGVDILGTGSIKPPVGTTAQRNGSPTAGDFRYNSTEGKFEGYTTEWGDWWWRRRSYDSSTRC